MLSLQSAKGKRSWHLRATARLAIRTSCRLPVAVPGWPRQAVDLGLQCCQLSVQLCSTCINRAPHVPLWRRLPRRHRPQLPPCLRARQLRRRIAGEQMVVGALLRGGALGLHGARAPRRLPARSTPTGAGLVGLVDHVPDPRRKTAVAAVRVSTWVSRRWHRFLQDGHGWWVIYPLQLVPQPVQKHVLLLDACLELFEFRRVCEKINAALPPLRPRPGPPSRGRTAGRAAGHPLGHEAVVGPRLEGVPIADVGLLAMAGLRPRLGEEGVRMHIYDEGRPLLCIHANRVASQCARDLRLHALQSLLQIRVAVHLRLLLEKWGRHVLRNCSLRRAVPSASSVLRRGRTRIHLGQRGDLSLRRIHDQQRLREVEARGEAGDCGSNPWAAEQRPGELRAGRPTTGQRRRGVQAGGQGGDDLRKRQTAQFQEVVRDPNLEKTKEARRQNAHEGEL
mmetsp:Transcript_141485/g.452286  ORF Transcript_141485/g.452286 Transcript_141485/m.452286 type:complete len:450 (+) Transcript_141485:52-1401(+)